MHVKRFSGLVEFRVSFNGMIDCNKGDAKSCDKTQFSNTDKLNGTVEIF